MLDDAQPQHQRRAARTITAHLGRREPQGGAARAPTTSSTPSRSAATSPRTVIDFEIPKKYGLRQTIADTLGIGGIFRALRTIPVMLDFARDMEEVCPDAWFLNYVNPMAMITGAMLRGIGRSAPSGCATPCRAAPTELLEQLGMLRRGRRRSSGRSPASTTRRWLLEITDERQGPVPRDQARAPPTLNAGRAQDRRRQALGHGAPRDHAPLRLLRHRILRAHRRVHALLDQEPVSRADRRVQHPARRVSRAAASARSQRWKKQQQRAGRQPEPDAHAHARVRLVHHGGHRDRRAVPHRRQRAQHAG